jgi:3-oxoacyl-[acyl-carrier protein] reductase
MSRIMLLTGCASGIGLHLAGALSARGDRVLATDVDEEALKKRAHDGGWESKGVRSQKLDVRSAEDWEAALDFATSEWGGVDVVMNIAGVLRPGYIQSVTPADIDFHMDVNVKGTALGLRAAAARMIPRRSGHIINFGSLASLAPVPGLSLYTASKFAVRGLSLAAAMELQPHGVSVTVVMPDAVQTPMLDLQVHFAEAALTFSGDKPLTVADVERLLIDKVLPQKPLEVAFPLARGALARAANAAPGITKLIAPMLVQKGLAMQERVRGGKKGS